MGNLTSTVVIFTDRIWENMSKKEKNIFGKFKEQDFLIEGGWVSVSLFNTNGDNTLEYMKEYIKTFCGVVCEMDCGRYRAYVQVDGVELYDNDHFMEESEPSLPEDEDDSVLMDKYEKEKEEWAEGYLSLFRKVVDEIKPVLEKSIRSPLFIFNKQEIDSLISKHCKGDMDNIINVANDISLDKKISVACMIFISNSGDRNHVNKLNRFFIYESPAGSPHGEEINVRIVSKGEDIPANDHPGDVYVITKDEVNKFSPEGRDQYAELSEDEFLILEDNLFFKRYKEDNSPDWLKINNERPYFLAVGAEPQISGELANYLKVSKLLHKRKEIPYYIIGRNMIGKESRERNIYIIYSCSLKDLPLKGFGDLFNYCYYDRSKPKSKGNPGDPFSIEERSYIDMVRNDVCRLENCYLMENVFSGLLNIAGMSEGMLQKVKSIIVNKGKCLIQFSDESKKELKVVNNINDLY